MAADCRLLTECQLCGAATGEIGVPPYFAKRLSFPEPVTPWNAAALAAAVCTSSLQSPSLSVPRTIPVRHLSKQQSEQSGTLCSSMIYLHKLLAPGAGWTRCAAGRGGGRG